MNSNDTTPSASVPDATPGSESGISDTPLGTTHFLTLAGAKEAADTAMSSALAKGYPVSVTVVDVTASSSSSSVPTPPRAPR